MENNLEFYAILVAIGVSWGTHTAYLRMVQKDVDDLKKKVFNGLSKSVDELRVIVGGLPCNDSRGCKKNG